jgi:internalin A
MRALTLILVGLMAAPGAAAAQPRQPASAEASAVRRSLGEGGSAERDGGNVTAAIEAQGGDVVRDEKGQIVEVSLARTWATDADVERVATIKGLKRLDLSLTYVSDRGAERLKALDQLEELNLYAAEFITDAALAFLRGNHQLTRLNLRGTDVTDTSLAYIAELSHLRSLDISFTQVSDVGMEHLAELSELEELNVGGNKISGVGLHVLKLLPKLKKLSFYGIQRRNAGWCWAPVVTDQELDTISLLAGLEDLNLGLGVALGTPRPTDLGPADGEAECRVAGGTRVTDLGLTKLARLKKLQHLDLSGSAITPAGVKALASLPELRRLSLWNVKTIDDSAAAQLAALGSLTSLDLSNTTVSDQTLTTLGKLPNLKRLYVSETPITADAVAAFQKQHPATVVSWGTRPDPRIPLSPGNKNAKQ